MTNHLKLFSTPTNFIILGAQDKLKSDSLTDDELFSIIRTKIEEIFPETAEPQRNILKRAIEARKIITKYLMENNLISSESDTSSEASSSKPKVVLLAHNGFLLEYNSLNSTPTMPARGPSSFPNCKLIPDYTDYTNLDI